MSSLTAEQIRTRAVGLISGSADQTSASVDCTICMHRIAYRTSDWSKGYRTDVLRDGGYDRALLEMTRHILEVHTDRVTEPESEAGRLSDQPNTDPGTSPVRNAHLCRACGRGHFCETATCAGCPFVAHHMTARDRHERALVARAMGNSPDSHLCPSDPDMPCPVRGHNRGQS